MTEIPVNKDDLISIKRCLDSIVTLSRENDRDGEDYRRGEIGFAALTMRRVIDFYLSGGRDD